MACLVFCINQNAIRVVFVNFNNIGFGEWMHKLARETGFGGHSVAAKNR
jgi:hypothetical protein